MDGESMYNFNSVAVEHFQFGMEKYFEGLFQQAKAEFLMALESDDRIVLAYCYLSSIYCDYDNDFDTAIALCRQGIEIEFLNPFLHFCLGSALDVSGSYGSAGPRWCDILVILPCRGSIR